ncbi:unnamed protein product [Ostreobium quekettii]|uniref:Gfo/Idh/MocA-like oxidoreductase N-terminal domain-containing protein n=1 Tax=Ostreobium quekettii TaxID=121088 RepID=A0A8S1IU13_9CHLO|nr:unnamed protein product [Ostreobium quekettii]|eukprot:evm.model.scf_525.2 EVM.evm.TU.scf_525.2   scf_525:4542-8901(-)
MAPVRVALLGAGIYARDAYVPLLLRQVPDDLQLTHVWSRSQSSVNELLPIIKESLPNVTAHWGEDGLEAILSNPDVEAVIVVLAVQAMLKVVEQALGHGKHVLQEKPVGCSFAEAAEAIARYRAMPKALWNYGENYRFEEVFLQARDICKNLGKIVKLDLVADMAMNEENKYFRSDWRRDAEGCPGGFMMESSVHFIGALRLVAQGCGCGEPVLASGLALNAVPDKLPPPDTVIGWLKFESGVPAGVSFTFAALQVKWALRVIGVDGTLEILRGGGGGHRGCYTLRYKTPSMTDETEVQVGFTGMERELRQFAGQVNARKRECTADASDAAIRAQPEQGARDIAVFEALWRSSKQHGMPVVVETMD